MKKTFKALFTVLAAAVVTVLVGCASAATLMSRGDNVGAIEKLASTLTKKPADQESADYFTSLYPSEVENRLQYTEKNVPDIINEWVSAQGQTSLTAALRARKQAVGSSKFLADDGEIRSLINEMEITHDNLKDLDRIQRAVVKMPSEIGDTEVYFVEKYSDNFTGMYQIAKRSMAEFYYELGNASAPGATRSQKIQLYELYGKVNEYSTGYSGLSAKRAESAYAVAEDYLAGNTVEEKKEALNWFNKANIAVTNYNDTNTRIRETNYLIGLQYLANYADIDVNSVSEYKIRSDLNNAIKYFEDSKGYKDANTWIAKCRDILAKLDNPDTVARSGTDAGTTNTGTTNTGTTNNSGSTNSGNTTTPAVTAKASVLVPDAAKFTLGSNNKINAAVSVVTQGDVSLSKDNITLVTNTAGATVKSITMLKSIDSTFTKYKTRDVNAKTGSYTINFELEKAGQFIFRILDAKGNKVDLVTADGKADTISPTYTLSSTEYNKLIPAKESTPSTPSTPSTSTVTAPVVLVDSNAKYSVVNKKVNATVNIAVEGDLAVTTSNIKFDANTAGATVKSVAPAKALDTSLTKIQTPVKTKTAATKISAYTITFELSKAGQFIFRVLDAKGGKVQHNATNGNKDTCSPIYTLSQGEYDKLIPPVVTTPNTPTPIVVKPTMVADSAAKFSQGANSKVNAAVNVVVVGDLNLAAGNIKLGTNTAGATVKSVAAQKAVDSTLSKSKPLASLKSTAKTTGYVITFELTKAGQFSFNVVDSTTVKNPGQVEITTIEGKTSTVSPIYTLTQAEYEKIYPPKVTTPSTPTPIVVKPTMVADSVAKFSKGTNSKVNAAVNVVVIGDLNLAAGNVKLGTNTAGATVKSVTAQSAIDSTLTKSKSLTTLKSKTKTTGYVITFELSKAGQFSFNVVDSTIVKSPNQIEISTIEGKASTVSPIYTLSQTEYEKLYPPVVTPTPTPVVTKASVLVPATANFKLGTGDKVNATITVLTQGDVTLAANSFRMVTNTANATVKSVEPLKSIDTSFSTFKTRDLKATKTASYKVTFELAKAGQFTFNVIDAKGGKIDLATADGRTDVISPIYKISDTDYEKLIPKVSTITYKDGQYSTNSAEYYIPFALVNYSSPVSMNEINVTKNTTGGTVTVTGTAADAKITIRNMTKTGVFSFTYKDRNTGKVMANTNAKAIPEYSIDFNKVWVRPTLQYFKKSSSAYQTYEPTVKVPFEVTGLTYYLSKNNINVGSNVCGAVWTLEHENVSSLGRNTAVKYYVVLSDIKKSGDFTYSVLDNAGKVMTSTTNKTTDTMTVDFSKVFAQSVMYNESMFYSKAGEINTNFNTYGITEDITVNNIYISQNGTGAKVKSVTRSDSAKLSYMRVYSIVFTGVKTDGPLSFFVRDKSGKNLAVVYSVNGDEISAPTRNPVAKDVPTYNIKREDIKSEHQIVYGSAATYPRVKGQVAIPFTIKASGTAPTFTTSNVYVTKNDTGASVASVQSLGNNSYNIILSNVTRSGTFQYRIKDANGYTITPEGFKNSGGATHSSVQSPAYSINTASIFDGLSTLKVSYDSAVTYPTTVGTAKLTFTVTNGVTKAASKDLTVSKPATIGPVNGIPGTSVSIQSPTALKLSNVDIRVNGTNATASLTHLGSGKYELLLTGVTRTGTFQFQLKDSDGNLISYTTSNATLSPAYTIDTSKVASAKIKTADTVVYASENNAVVEKLAITSEGGLTLAASNFTLVTNTCGAKIVRLDRTGTTNNYTLVLSATKAGKFSFSVTVGSVVPTVYRTADTMYKKAASTPKNVSSEFEVSVASGGTLDEKLQFLKELDGFKPAQMLDVNTLKQKTKGTVVEGLNKTGAVQGTLNGTTTGTVQGTLNGARTGTVQINDSLQDERNKVQDKIEADGALKGSNINSKLKK